MRLVFVHGWALGPEAWDFVSPLLGSFPQARVDLGYFGAPRLPDPLAGDILVGHSAGFLWGLRQRADWAGMVAINSFSRFCLDARRIDTPSRGCIKPAALRAMRGHLSRDAEGCVKSFRASIGAPIALKPVEAPPLAEGLELLRAFDALPHLGAKPFLVLAAKDDALAPTGEAENLSLAAGASLFFNEKGGHGLPWTAPEFCAEKIEKYLQAHEF